MQITQKSEAKKEMQMSLSGYICSYAFIEDQHGPSATQSGQTPVTTIFGTTDGQLYLMNKNFELRGPLDSSPAKYMEIVCIAPRVSGKGFIVAGDSKQFIVFDEKPNNVKNPFEKVERAPIQNKAYENISVNALVHLNDEYMVAGLKDGRLIRIKVNSERTGGTEGYEFTNLVGSSTFHSGQLNDVDIAVMKPLIATCSADKWVRIWNYDTKERECECEFREEPRMLSFHPSGFHIAIAFQTKVLLMNILMQEMEVLHEMNEKACTALAYSNGGQYFAIAKQSQVVIFSSYTGENISNLTLKQEGQTINKILWMQDDFRIMTMTQSQITEWSFDLDRSEKLVLHSAVVINNPILGTSFDCTNFNLRETALENTLVATTPENFVYTVAIKRDDLKHREKDVLGEVKKKEGPIITIRPTGSKISAVRFTANQQVLLMGTGQPGVGLGKPGVLRLYKFPLTGLVQELQLHSKPITKILTPKNDSVVVTIGEDNIMTITRLKWENDTSVADLPFAKEYLYRKSKYVDKNRDIETMSNRLRANQEVAKRVNDEITRNKQLADQEMATRNRAERDTGERKINELKEELKQMDDEFDRKLKDLREANQKYIQNFERMSDDKVLNEGKRHEERFKQKTEKERQNAIVYEELLKVFAEEKRLKEAEYMVIFEEEKVEREKLTAKKEEINAIHNAEVEAIESEADAKIDKMRRDYDIRLKLLDNENSRQALSLDKARKEYHEGVNDNLKVEESLNNNRKDNNNATARIATDKARRVSLENDIEEREETIRKKNERTKELDRKTQELEKFKFVLKYKIGELRREIGPREQEIAKMKEQLETMRSEVKEFNRTNGHLLLFVNEFDLQLEGIREEIRSHEKKIQTNSTFINAYQIELSEVCKMIQKNQDKDVKKKVIEMYNKYVTNEKKMTDINVDKQQRMIKRREQLENDIEATRSKFKENGAAHSMENRRIQKEEVDLIVAINELKRELHDKHLIGALNQTKDKAMKDKKIRNASNSQGGEMKNSENVKDAMEKIQKVAKMYNDNLEFRIRQLREAVQMMSEHPLPADFRM